MPIVSPMTYTALEALVGDFVQDSGLTRYDQDDRQRGIVWAEIQALRHLPEDDVRNLIFTEGIASDASGIVVPAELSPTAPKQFFGVLDIYNIALSPITHFKQIPQELLPLRDSLMFKYGHHWYYSAMTAAGIGATDAVPDTGRTIQLKANTDSDYKGVLDSDLFMTYKVFPSSYQGNFGALLVPFERNEELIAIGAAGFIWDQDGDARGQELLQKFYQGIGFSDDSARRT